MQRKIYNIDNNKFYMKDDLTVEESETVQEILSAYYLESDNDINGMAGSINIRKFLAIVLEPVSATKISESFDYGRAKESVAIEIVKDFFLKRFRLTVNTAEYFRNLMNEFKLPLKNSNG